MRSSPRLSSNSAPIKFVALSQLIVLVELPLVAKKRRRAIKNEPVVRSYATSKCEARDAMHVNKQQYLFNVLRLHLTAIGPIKSTSVTVNKRWPGVTRADGKGLIIWEPGFARRFLQAIHPLLIKYFTVLSCPTT